MTMPANVVAAGSSLLVLSCAAPLGNVSVAEPSVAGATPPCQFAPVLQLLSPPFPVHVHDLQPELKATAILTIFPEAPKVPLKDVALPCAAASRRYPPAT